MEKNLNKLLAVLMALVLSISLSSCGDDDDPIPYDPEKPYLGTWEVVDVRNFSWRSYVGGMLLDEDKTRNELIQKWMGKTIKFNSKTKVEDERIIYSDNNNQTEYFEVTDATENAITVRYVMDTYFHEKGELASRTSATMDLKRK